jgi:2-(1,2-epoxy-1,2-dihydrophenyl)acetyl-CoA isomerase
MSQPETVLEVEDGVAVFTLNRPEKMNAITQKMFEKDLPDFVDQIERDDGIRVVVITGAGGNFCSGADVSAMGGATPRSPEDRDRHLRKLLAYLYRLINLGKPVISAVDGVAFGGGLSLALTADIVLATPRARFCLVFGRIGLIPDMAGAYLLPRLIGPQRTKELAFTARSISADEALAMGIVQDINEPENLLAAAKLTARRMSRGSPEAIAEAKKLIDMSIGSSQAEMIDAECVAQLACRGTEFHQEAVRRFVNKEPRLYDWDAMVREDAAD